MHYIYLLLNPLKGFLNYLLGWYPWLVVGIVIILGIRYFVLVKFRFQQIYLFTYELVQVKKEQRIGISRWYAGTSKSYLDVGTPQMRNFFALKMKYLLMGVGLIVFGWTIVSVLFYSVSSGLGDAAEKKEFKVNSTMFAKEELNTLIDQGIVEKTSLQVFDEVYVGKINYLLGYGAFYVLLCFIMSGFFFTISLGNSCLKNVGWLFFIGGLLVFFCGIILQLYSYQLWAE